METLIKKYDERATVHKRASRCFYRYLMGAIFLSSVLIFILSYLIFDHFIFCDCVSCHCMLCDCMSCYHGCNPIRANFWLSFFSLLVLSIFFIFICILIRNKAREESGMSAEYMHKSYAIEGFLALMKVADCEKVPDCREISDYKKDAECRKLRANQEKRKNDLFNLAIETINTNPRANLDKNRDDY